MAISRRRDRKFVARGLNRGLYGRLVSRIGEVQIGNDGMAASPGVPSFDHKRKEMKTEFSELGEYYKLCCPYCGDNGFRLWVNHLWCTPDPISGKPMKHLAICYHGDCLKKNYEDFEERVFGWENDGVRQRREAMASMHVLPGIEIPAEVGAVSLPGECWPLDELPETHPAMLYLMGRGFDPASLVRDHDVSLCVRGEGRFEHLTGRLIIPVKTNHVLVGWQARYLGDIDFKTRKIPKYFTKPGFRKSHYLYNHDRVAATSPRLVLVVEGVTDAWVAGRFAVAAFGKSISQAQHQLLARWGSREGLCLLCLDPEAWTEEVRPNARERAQAKRIDLLDRLTRNFSGRVIEVVLPPGQDPGMLGTDKLIPMLKAQAAAAGFNFDHFSGS